MSDEKQSKDAVEPGRSKGGKARAKSLSASERKEIAKKAADARWDKNISDVVAGSPENPLKIGEAEIECYVLNDKDQTRIVTQGSLLEAMGRHKRPYNRSGSDLPPILQGKSISEFVSKEVIELARPIPFSLPTGGRASGYNALILPELCEIYLKAQEAGTLPANQKHVAARAGILVRGLARVGIIALVDEATGYQDARTRRALAQILEAYIDKELNAWVQTFPEDFYKNLFRLRNIEYDSGSVKRPQYFGHLTNDIVYKRLAPSVLDELKEIVPKDSSGRRKHKFFQHLTTNTGYPKLLQHLGSVTTIMKLNKTWDGFMSQLDQLHPRYGDTMVLPFEDNTGIGL